MARTLALASGGPAAPSSDPLDPAEALRFWPPVTHALRERGVELRRLEGEDEESVRNRIGTRLMALYRDERSAESFEALYSFSCPAVLQWIRGLLARGRSHLDPAELLQDTFVNVYRYPTAFREDHAGSFRVWVRTIAGNIVRRASAPRSRFSFQELPEGLQEPEDTSENPVRLAEADEQEDRLKASWILFLQHYARAWEGLSQRDRRTLHLVEVEGLSYQEAGAVLRVGRSNMKMIVFRSRKRMARAMRNAMAGGRATLGVEGRDQDVA